MKEELKLTLESMTMMMDGDLPRRFGGVDWGVGQPYVTHAGRVKQVKRERHNTSERFHGRTGMPSRSRRLESSQGRDKESKGPANMYAADSGGPRGSSGASASGGTAPESGPQRTSTINNGRTWSLPLLLTVQPSSTHGHASPARRPTLDSQFQSRDANETAATAPSVPRAPNAPVRTRRMPGQAPCPHGSSPAPFKPPPNAFAPL
ncbi:uncharacterized protein J3D65DRAFT_687095 [Phyllosticta citribraziliensis]|uniref:Uncharacterized protein n=1 Tax=Phyllosticta citribraziliensis TaxID=989973 RepID=A0ABR1L5W7_9PEZI